MGAKFSYWLVIAGLLALMLVLPWWLQANAARLGIAGAILGGATGPALLLFMTLTHIRNWSGITALCMIPFAVIGVMDLVANLQSPDSGLLLAVLAIVTFFAALDAGRRHRP